MSQVRVSLNESLRCYLAHTQPAEHQQLIALRARTQMMPRAAMQITAEQGHLLAFLIRLMGARRVLELGTFTGYSTMAVALALPADGEVIACECDEECVNVGRPFWARAGFAANIHVRIGCALESLASLERERSEPFDFVFIDADKTEYDRYYESALRLVRPGGLVVLDNTLQRGEVAKPEVRDPRTISVRELNRKISTDDRVDHVVLPIADGVTLLRRKS